MKRIFIIFNLLLVISLLAVCSNAATNTAVTHFSAAAQQSEALKIKHQLEQQDAQLLKDKDAAGAKAVTSGLSIEEDTEALPFPEPDEYKTPCQWKPGGYTQRHGLIKTANTVWTVKGIIEPNQKIWDEFVAWSGANEDGKQIIGTFVDNGQVFNGKYDAIYVCPNQSIGKIYITSVKDSMLYFKADSGATGNFNLDSLDWDLE